MMPRDAKQTVVPGWVLRLAIASCLIAGIAFVVLWRMESARLEQVQRRHAALEQRFASVCDSVARRIDSIARDMRLVGPQAARVHLATVENSRFQLDLLSGLALRCMASTSGPRGAPDVTLELVLADLEAPGALDAAAVELAKWATWYSAELATARTSRWGDR